MGQYSAGWITVPGKGKRWRTADGDYLLDRPAGGIPGVLGAIKAALGGADRAVGGWLPLPPGIDAAQPPPNQLLDAAGLAALRGGAAASQWLQSSAVRFLTSTPEDQARREQSQVRRSFNRTPDQGVTVGPPSRRTAQGQSGALGVFLGESNSSPSKSWQSRASLFDVDALRGPAGADKFDPGGMLRDASNGAGRDVVTFGKQSPGWVAAHELGHLTDLRIQNPNDPFVRNSLARYQEDVTALKEGLQSTTPGAGNARLRSASPALLGMAGSSGRDRSLLQAAAEGAVEGLLMNAGTLRNEFMADRYGKLIAARAGVAWNPRANAIAKGTYITGAAMPSAAANVVGELASRGVEAAGDLFGEFVVDPLARRMRGGDSQVEKSLRQYGYDSAVHRLKPGRSGAIEVVRRWGAGQQ